MCFDQCIQVFVFVFLFSLWVFLSLSLSLSRCGWLRSTWVCLVRSPLICYVSVVDGCSGDGFDECGCVCGVGFVTDVVVVVGGCNGGGC